jgi:hypothetical protein
LEKASALPYSLVDINPDGMPNIVRIISNELIVPLDLYTDEMLFANRFKIDFV